jgi:hypothetical protein
MTCAPLTVYTAIAGGYDVLREPDEPWPGARYIAFVDAADSTPSPVWERRLFPETLATPRRTAKHPKILAHAVLPPTEYSLWLEALIAKYLKDSNIALLRHPHRDCLYEEARTCMRLHLDHPAILFGQVDQYRREGFPERAGLAEACVILRRHTPQVLALNTTWWHEIEHGSCRDQVSFPYAAWRLGVEYTLMPAKKSRETLFATARHLKPRTSG